MRFSEGAARISLAANTVTRLILPSIREVEVGREYEGYTITRTIVNLHASASTGVIVIANGMLLQNESVAIGNVNPDAEPHVDWHWWEEFAVGANEGVLDQGIHRDISSQRRARGGETFLGWYIVNRDVTNAVNIHRSGHVLVKRA